MCFDWRFILWQRASTSKVVSVSNCVCTESVQTQPDMEKLQSAEGCQVYELTVATGRLAMSPGLSGVTPQPAQRSLAVPLAIGAGLTAAAAVGAWLLRAGG